MAATEIFDDAALDALRMNFRGDLIRSTDAEYDAARSVFNGMIDKRPALIARCTGNADVAAALGVARGRGLPIAVRGGGHSVAGFSTCDGGVVVDLTRMRGVRVDPDTKTARAQGGCTWGDYDRETQVFGLASPGGLVSTTGVAGLTLGGGFGMLSFKHGLACDNLISADVVTADGRVVVASERENADLLWGLRGGGGNFGIVTSFEFRLHPVSEVTLGIAMYPIDQSLDVLRKYREFIGNAPDELLAFGQFFTVPEEPPMPIFPPEVLGQRMLACVGVWPETGEAAEKAVKQVASFGTPAFELTMPMPYTVAQSFQDDDMPWGSHSYWKSAYTADAPDALLEIVADLAPTTPSAFTQIAFGRFGGAIARGSEDDSAFPLRDAGWLVQMDSNWRDPAQADENIVWARKMYEAVEPFALDRVYVNFIGDEGEDRVPGAYGESRYAKLQALKTKYDPTNVFNLNQNIKPA